MSEPLPGEVIWVDASGDLPLSGELISAERHPRLVDIFRRAQARIAREAAEQLAKEKRAS